MGLFQKFKEGLRRTQEKVSREIKRIFTGSPKLTLESIEELEEALLGGDFGMALTTQIIAAVRREYEGQGRNGQSVLEIAQRNHCDLIVMASHGRSGWSAVLLGSETQKMLAHSPIHVLVVR